MTFIIQPSSVPVRVDEFGVARVGSSQVLLDIVIREFNNGASAEEIAHAYSTLKLADVYAVIAYYLEHRDDVDKYLRTRREKADALRKEIEAKQPDRASLRSRLLARQAQLDQGNASASL